MSVKMLTPEVIGARLEIIQQGAGVEIAPSVTPDRLREALRIEFEKNAERPLLIGQAIAALLDEVLADVPEAMYAHMRVLERAIRDTCTSLGQLVPDGYAEGAWVRADTALMLMERYVELLKLTQESQGH